MHLRQRVGCVASSCEIINIYPHRWTVPSDLWRNFFDNTENEIGILVYSGLFVSEDAGIHRIFREKADAGARVRIVAAPGQRPPVPIPQQRPVAVPVAAFVMMRLQMAHE